MLDAFNRQLYRALKTIQKFIFRKRKVTLFVLHFVDNN